LKPRANLWEEIVSFSALLRATRRAARNKRAVRGVAKWLADLEPRCLNLERQLRAGSWRPGKPTTFVIHDPKTRTITAAPFEDRVVHHALMDALEPTFEAVMLPHSFACRKGKGTHAAVRRARELVREHEWFLKLDVANFFGSLAHRTVLETLAQVVNDERVLSLARTIVCSGGSGGRGLPIGNLTSQWLANLVLNRLDMVVTGSLNLPGYIRYMDDFVLFAATKAELKRALRSVTELLKDELQLELKARATMLATVHQGLPFLGWRIYRGTTRLRPANKKRLRARLRSREQQYGQGAINDATYLACVRSAFEHLRHGDTLSLRRRWLEDLAGHGSQTLQQTGSPAVGSATRINRGGSYNNTAVNARSANRNNNAPTNANNNLGLRPAKADSPQEWLAAPIGRNILGVPAAVARDAQVGVPRQAALKK